MKKIRQIKESTTAEELFPRYRCHPEFAAYLTYCRNLDFEAVPDYQYLKDLFQTIIKREIQGSELKEDFDWVLKRKDLISKYCGDEHVSASPPKPLPGRKSIFGLD